MITFLRGPRTTAILAIPIVTIAIPAALLSLRLRPASRAPRDAVAAPRTAGVVAAAVFEVGASTPVRKLPALPVAFVENRGQWPTSAAFVAAAGNTIARIEPGAIVLQRTGHDDSGQTRGVLVRLGFEGSLGSSEIRGVGKLTGRRHYFVGPDPAHWKTDVEAYSSVVYAGLYEGVDARVREANGSFEYDFGLAPEADLRRLVVRVDGGSGLSIDASGALVLQTAIGPIVQPTPIAWREEGDGGRRHVDCRYRILDGIRYGFDVEDHEAAPLVIDPGILWSTYVGGSSWESAYAVSADPGGTVTIVGQTGSMSFPTTPGCFDPSYNGQAFSDVFVTRINGAGNALAWSTFVGGSQGEEARGISVDAAGVATVSGTTSSSGFPTTPGAYQTSLHGSSDAFVLRLSASGSSLVFSTLLGGSSGETGTVVAVDAGGASTVSGTTSSANFPTTPGAYDTIMGGPSDTYVARLDATGSALVWATLLGGSGGDVGAGVMLDAAGIPTIVGTTDSQDFPTTPGAHQTSLSGSSDAYVARLNATGTGLLFSTLIGGSAGDTGECVAIEPSGGVAVAGVTSSADFQTTPGAWDSVLDGSSDVFVTRVDATGTTLTSSTLVGGSGGDVGKVIALDRSGSAVVAGVTSSSDFPSTPGCHDSIANGSGDAFCFRVSSNGAVLLYATLLGGATGDTAEGMAVDALGQPFVAGTTSSSDFPVTPGAPDPTTFGSSEAFVTHLDLLPWGAARFGAPTWGCSGPPTLGVTSIPAVGNQGFALMSWNGPPLAAGVLAVSSGGLTSPLLAGALQIWIDVASPAFSFFDLMNDAQGGALLPVPLPGNPGLVGAGAFLQAAWPDGCVPGGLSASHGLAIVVQP